MTMNIINASITSFTNWSLTHTPANAIDIPAALAQKNLSWLPAIVPGTVAQSLRVAGQEKFPHAIDSDNYDWWYQCEFTVEKDKLNESKNYFLHFDGLATLAEIWLNNQLILSTNNMFVPEAINVASNLSEKNHLVICFRSAAYFLQQKRPRPHWKTNLVNHQQLRWLRTTLLGRIPGWCPPLVPIGPWRNITLQEHPEIELISEQITNVLDSDFGFSAEFQIQIPDVSTNKVNAQLRIGKCTFDLVIHINNDNSVRLTTSGKISEDDCWWPHAHGSPTLLACKITLEQNNSRTEFDLGLRGFKQLHLNRHNNLVEIQVNKKVIFCRGACWTNADIETLTGTKENLRRSLELARDAGMNMLRVGGTMVYECDDFYQLCDELGIMVWQDFMFANMDYPIDDADFSANIKRETEAQLHRLSRYTCISVYCGSSEVQQQSAMMGQTSERWSNHFFDIELKQLCAYFHAGVPYFPSTPCEGALPFSVNEGLSHYYGVGAYKRSLQDAVIVQVKFTPETLGFANIPEPEIVDEVLGGSIFTAHHPSWKKTVPRDSSAGWDFEDIRDFYLAQLFKVDAVHLRSHDPQRYLELSRVVTGELMLRTLANWRSASSTCRGALLWFYKDLIPGGGWGLLDSKNNPKAAYYGVKRACSTLAVYFLDKGLDGLYLSFVNETGSSRNVKLTLKAFKNNHIETLSFNTDIFLGEANLELSINELLGYFTDLNYSYGFGPKQQDVIYVCVENEETGEWLHDDAFFVGDYNLSPQAIHNIQMDVEDNYLNLTSAVFLQFVRLDITGYEPEDNYFHLAPNVTRRIKLSQKCNAANKSKNETTRIKGYLEAVNLINSIRILQ